MCKLGTVIWLNVIVRCIANEEILRLDTVPSNDHIENDRTEPMSDKVMTKIIITTDQHINDSGSNVNESVNELNETGNIYDNDFDGNLTDVPTSVQNMQYNDEENMYNPKIGLFLFTKYCGPGDRDWKNIPLHSNQRDLRSYRDIDACCKAHDGCQNYVENSSEFEKFPGLPPKAQLFARLQCSCDGGFYKCLNDIRSNYANSVAVGYGLVQAYCFDLEYPIVRCDKYSFGFGMRRCEEYIVDASKPKAWQWFNLPPAYKKIYDFPRTKTG